MNKKFSPVLGIILLVFVHQANPQLLKKLVKTAGQSAQKTVEDRVSNTSSDKTDKGIDKIFGGKSISSG